MGRWAMCGHRSDDRGRCPEPLRPGWYPVGDGRHQQYYGGRDRGWTDDFTVDIECRDPRHLDTSTRTHDGLLLVLVVSAAIVASVTLAVLDHWASPWG